MYDRHRQSLSALSEAINIPDKNEFMIQGRVPVPCYANEVGEAFRPLVHKMWVKLSYGVAFAYVLADTADKTWNASKEESGKETYQIARVAIVAGDTLLWQTLASVAIPGLTINRLCALSLYTMKKLSRWPTSIQKWSTTAIGLASIPFIVTPIDRGVDRLMDSTIRKWIDDVSEEKAAR